MHYLNLRELYSITNLYWRTIDMKNEYYNIIDIDRYN